MPAWRLNCRAGRFTPSTWCRSTRGSRRATWRACPCPGRAWTWRSFVWRLWAPTGWTS
ncbi:unnamed protein product [Effrenium voratum]|nr:unnamed protein product [Effrenium voratum]